jgi:hypothetical protein
MAFLNGLSAVLFAVSATLHMLSHDVIIACVWSAGSLAFFASAALNIANLRHAID